MTQKTLGIAVLFFFSISLLEGLFSPTHAEGNEAESERVTRDAKTPKNEGENLDWVDNLAHEVAAKKEWNAQVAKKIMEKLLKDDEALIKSDEEAIAKMEQQIKNAPSGVAGTLGAGVDKASLTALKTKLWTHKKTYEYHQKIYKALQELGDNKRDRERLTRNLIDLDKHNKKLQEFEKNYEKAQGSEKVKLMFPLNLQRVKTTGKRKYIEFLFLKETL